MEFGIEDCPPLEDMSGSIKNYKKKLQQIHAKEQVEEIRLKPKRKPSEEKKEERKVVE